MKETLDAEQIKKALECCATKQFCAFDSPCPWEYMHGGNRLYADALALINSQEQRIKKLTEENEKIGIENFDLICELSRIKEDTVRKMQERINAHFDSDSDYFRSSHGYIRSVIDQIAKEMLEGINGIQDK